MNNISVNTRAKKSVSVKFLCLIAFVCLCCLCITGCQKQKDNKAAIIEDCQKQKDNKAAIIEDCQKQKDNKAAIIEILEFDKMVGDARKESARELDCDVLSRLDNEFVALILKLFENSVDTLMTIKSMQKKLNQTEVCNEFKTAYQKHIDSWNKQNDLLKNMFISGNFSNIANLKNYAHQSTQISKEIDTTFNNVLIVAKKYGVDIEKYK